LQKIIALSAKTGGQKLCREFWLWGAKNYSGDVEADARAAREVSLLLAPALLRGWVESNSDIHGRVCYWATPTGREASEKPAPPPPDDLPGWTVEAAKFYHAETLAARERLRTATPVGTSEIGFVPLSASLDLQCPCELTERTR
jgi:hypothetical protein